MLRWLLRLVALGAFIGIAFLSYGYWEATRPPIARTATIALKDWPDNMPPLRIVLLADTQMAGPDMTPERLKDITAQINREKADLVLLGGDYISEKTAATAHYSADEAIAPLADLQARLGVVAVLGNHDYWANEAAFIAALKQYNISLLRNQAIAIGPVNLVGIDDEFTGHADVMAASTSLALLPDAPNLVLTHDPDIIPDIPFDTALIMAGHTHCGQIVLPFIGPLTSVSKYGMRFHCGLFEDEGRKIVITAGTGTSILPLRIGARPDYWVITLLAADDADA